ncbi:MAG TPA: acyltransferase family protein [Gammaproteobacteria bacterium]
MEISTRHNPLLSYRPDIDGLRAVAVLAVIVFHVDERLLPGGFLGVDIFFVISGYLITLLLLKGIERDGRLDFVDFYRRRVQRILPALLFMLLAVVPAGFLLMAPADFRDLLAAALASVLSLANIYFHSELETGYFAAPTNDVPLLHVWSLGVEEQFYLLWPFIVMLLVTRTRSPRVRYGCVVLALLASLAAAHWLAIRNPSFAYYMLPTRAWELLAGGLAAFAAARGFSFSGRWRHLPGIAGLGLLAAGLVIVNESHAVPGLPVIPVVLGAVLVVLSPVDALSGRVLSLRPLVATGLVSYSAYLWHWPILAFLRYALVEISWPVGLAAVTATLLAAAFSYRFVERPLRRLRLPRRKILVRYLAAPAAFAFIVFTPALYAIDHEVPGIYAWDRYRALDDATKAAFEYDFNCQYSSFDGKDFSEARCVHPQGADPDVLLIGDSNAAHYLGMLRVFAEHGGFSLRNATQSSCPPLFGVDIDWVNPLYEAGCRTYRKVAAREAGKYETVILGGSWTYFEAASDGKFRESMAATVRDLASRVPRVVILAKAPTFRDYNRECDVRRLRLTFIDCEQRFRAGNRDFGINAFLRDLAEAIPNVHYFDIRHVLCGKDCSPYIEGNPVYFDDGHISMEGSRVIGEVMLRSRDPAMLALLNVLGDDALAAGTAGSGNPRAHDDRMAADEERSR